MFPASQTRKHTVADVINRYCREVLGPRGTDGEIRARQLEWWRGALGHYLVADATPARIAEARDALALLPARGGEVRSPATIGRYLAALSHCFTVAVKEWGWATENPLFKVTKPAEPRGRVRFLDPAERARLLAACRASPDPHLHDLVVVALSTGMRQSEIVTLTWADVNLETERITLQETKNGERRVVPLVGPALDLMRRRFASRSPEATFIFESRKHGDARFPRKAWTDAVSAAELEDFRFHDLRHSAASYLAMGGASIVELADILGHKTLQMVQRYAHLSEPHTRKVLASMNAQIFSGAAAVG